MGSLNRDCIVWCDTPPVYISCFLQTGLTALHVAAHYGQIEFVRDMLTKVPATIRSEQPHSTDGPLRDIGSEVCENLFSHLCRFKKIH